MPELNGIKFPANWKIEKISNLCEFIVDCIHDTPNVNETFTGYYMIRTSDIGNGQVNLNGARFVSKEVYEFRIQRGKPQWGDIVISREAPLGNVGQLLTNKNICLGQRLIHYRPNKRLVDSRFLLFAMLSPLVQLEFRANSGTGSIVDNLRMQVARDLPIPIPPMEEQYAIAEILGALDDKVELNRRMNRTLESMAQVVFRKWFVESEEIETWESLPLSKLCESIFSGGTPSTSNPEYWDGELPWLSSGETRNRFIIETEKNITQTGVINSSTRLARSGSTLIASAGQGKTRGQTSLLMFDSYINQSVVVLNANKCFISDLFLFFNLSQRYEEFRQLSDSHSSRGSLTTKLLGGLQILTPPMENILEFDRYAKPIVELIRQNLHQSRTLACLRDLLLPKLMSGEVRVSEP